MFLRLDLKGTFYRVVLQFVCQLPPVPEELNDPCTTSTCPKHVPPHSRSPWEESPFSATTWTTSTNARYYNARIQA
eukprot:1826554-Pyramimonas_sp.AAC.1